MMKKLLVLTLVCLLCSCAAANKESQAENQPAAPATDQQKTESLSWSKIPGDSVNVKMVAKFLSETASFQLPRPFVPAFDQPGANNTSYLAGFVPEGENVEKWSQMILVTGYSNLAANKNVTPASLSQQMASQVKSSCPTTFSSLEFKPTKIGGHEAEAAVMGCGVSSMSKGTDSQMTLVIFIKGEKDYYSVQWAERGKVSKRPPPIDEGKWKARFQKLSPITLMSATEAPPPNQK